MNLTGSSTKILTEVAWSFVILLLHEVIAIGYLTDTVINQLMVLLVPFELVAFTLTLWVPAKLHEVVKLSYLLA